MFRHQEPIVDLRNVLILQDSSNEGNKRFQKCFSFYSQMLPFGNIIIIHDPTTLKNLYFHWNR